MLIDGKYTKEIALELGKTPNAIKVCLFRAEMRMGVQSLYQLVALAVSLGLCAPPVRAPRGVSISPTKT